MINRAVSVEHYGWWPDCKELRLRGEEVDTFEYRQLFLGLQLRKTGQGMEMAGSGKKYF